MIKLQIKSVHICDKMIKKFLLNLKRLSVNLSALLILCKTCIYKYTAPNRHSRWPGLNYLVYYYTPQQHLYFYTCVLLYFKYIVLVFVISQRSDHNEQFRCFFWNSSGVALCFRAFLQTRAVWLGMWRHGSGLWVLLSENLWLD